MQFQLRLFSTLVIGGHAVQRQAVTQHGTPDSYVFDRHDRAAAIRRFYQGDPESVEFLNKSAAGEQSNLAAGPPHCWPHQTCTNGDCCTWGTSCNSCPNSYYYEDSGFWGGWGCFWKGVHRCNDAKPSGGGCHTGNQCSSGVCKGYKCCSGNDGTCTSCDGQGQCNGCVSGKVLAGNACVNPPVVGIWTVKRGHLKGDAWGTKSNQFCGKDTDTFHIGHAHSNACEKKCKQQAACDATIGNTAQVVVNQDGAHMSDGWFCSNQGETEVQGTPTFDATRGAECEETHHIADDGL